MEVAAHLGPLRGRRGSQVLERGHMQPGQRLGDQKSGAWELSVVHSSNQVLFKSTFTGSTVPGQEGTTNLSVNTWPRVGLALDSKVLNSKGQQSCLSGLAPNPLTVCGVSLSLTVYVFHHSVTHCFLQLIVGESPP